MSRVVSTTTNLAAPSGDCWFTEQAPDTYPPGLRLIRVRGTEPPDREKLGSQLGFVGGPGSVTLS